jgi:hypothetical protein
MSRYMPLYDKVPTYGYSSNNYTPVEHMSTVHHSRAIHATTNSAVDNDKRNLEDYAIYHCTVHSTLRTCI